MIKTITKVKVLNCTGSQMNCKQFGELLLQKSIETEMYWDFGRITGFIVIFIIIYFLLVWLAKMVLACWTVTGISKRVVKECWTDGKPLAEILKDFEKVEKENIEKDPVPVI